MKCNEAEKWILLKDADELDKSQIEILDAHVSDCLDCQQFLDILSVAQKHVTATEEPSEKVIQNILREARTQAPVPKRAHILYWKPMLAVAASVMIALGLFFTNSSKTVDTVGMQLTLADNQLLNFDDQIVSVMYDGLSEDDLAFNFMMSYDG